MERFTVRATAKSVRRRNLILKTVLVILLILISLLAISYGLSVFLDKAGNFTVMVPEEADGCLTLSATSDFADPTPFLAADPIPEMTNITQAWIDPNVDNIDGPHNGSDYIAYTFYLKNGSDDAIKYNANIDIQSVALGTDEAVRIMVIRNGEKTVYGKAQVGSTEPETDGAVPFYSDAFVMNETYEDFGAGEVDKYTVVIWLEGNDPECVDNIRGGEMKMAMNFKRVKE